MTLNPNANPPRAAVSRWPVVVSISHTSPSLPTWVTPKRAMLASGSGAGAAATTGTAAGCGAATLRAGAGPRAGAAVPGPAAHRVLAASAAPHRRPGLLVNGRTLPLLPVRRLGQAAAS